MARSRWRTIGWLSAVCVVVLGTAVVSPMVARSQGHRSSPRPSVRRIRLVHGSGTLPAGKLGCPTASDCVAFLGEQLTRFDPRTGHVHSALSLPTVADMACPTATFCVLAASVGRADSRNDGRTEVLVLNPWRLASPRVVPLSRPLWGYYGGGFEGVRIACPSSSSCVMLGYRRAGATVIVTFDPRSAVVQVPARNVVMPPGTRGRLNGLSCPSAQVCLAGTDTPKIAVFTPSSMAAPRVIQAFPDAIRLEPGRYLNFDQGTHVYCRTVTDCFGDAETSVARCATCAPEGSGPSYLASVDPLHPADEHDVRRSPGLSTCVSASACLGLDGNRVISFDPRRPSHRRSLALGKPPELVGEASILTTLNCPSASECVALDAGADAITFKPPVP